MDKNDCKVSLLRLSKSWAVLLQTVRLWRILHKLKYEADNDSDNDDNEESHDDQTLTQAMVATIQVISFICYSRSLGKFLYSLGQCNKIFFHPWFNFNRTI